MAEKDSALEKWRSQIRKGFLELCVLAIVDGAGEAYGLDLMERLDGIGVEIAEGTLYPLLMRMTNETSLRSEWETPDRGHPRKYYRLTQEGAERLAAMREEYEAGYAAYRSIGARSIAAGSTATRHPS
jgi:PadR family transcriptional regulator PadR